MSSIGESPAQSSESALEMFPRRGSSGGVGQERSAEQNLPAPIILPTIQDQEMGSEDLGLSQSRLPQSSPKFKEGDRSPFVTPWRSRSGSQAPKGKVETGTKVQTSFGKVSSKSSPRGVAERKLSGRSTPADFASQNSAANPLTGADEVLARLIAQGQCASPGATSQGSHQGSQRALPDGEPMDVEEMAQKVGRERAGLPHFFQPPSLPDSAIMSPIPHTPVEVISTGSA